MPTTVVDMRKDDYDVRIDRTTKWGCPFKLKMDTPAARRTVCAKYEEYLRNNQELLDALPKLVGKRLGCWCAPRICHGNVLVKLIKERGLE
jgi:hypothetical protein